MSQITSSPGDRSVGDATAEPYPFASRFAVVDGHRMHYIDEGPRDADATMLMVHGNPTWSFYYRRLVSHFRDRVRCVAVDHIGCGLSDKPQQYRYTLAQHIDNLESLIDQCDLRNVTLVAHDWGGAIGLGALLKTTDRFNRVLLMNTAAFPPPYIPFRIAVCRWPFVGSWLVRGLNGFARAAITMATEQPGGLAPEVARRLLSPYDSWANRVAIHRFVKDIPTSPAHPTWQVLADIESKLGQLNEWPIELVWGMRDWCFRPECLDRLLDHWPNANASRLPEAGHYVMEDAPDEVIAAAERLLAN